MSRKRNGSKSAGDIRKQDEDDEGGYGEDSPIESRDALLKHRAHIQRYAEMFNI
jgi:hypothetical protein